MNAESPNTPTPATQAQRLALSALADRNASSHAYSADLWDDTNAAEATLNRSSSWRRYRRRHPR